MQLDSFFITVGITQKQTMWKYRQEKRRINKMTDEVYIWFLCCNVDHSLFKIVVLLVVLSVIKHFFSYFARIKLPNFGILIT